MSITPTRRRGVAGVTRGFPTIDLSCGHTANATGIVARPTYAGLLEGLPDAGINRRILEEAATWGSRYFHHAEYVVVEPEITVRRHRDRDVPMLPPVAIGALFISHQPAKDPEAHGSSLVVIWFQENVEPLLSDAVRPRIEGLDWIAAARDFLY